MTGPWVSALALSAAVLISAPPRRCRTPTPRRAAAWRARLPGSIVAGCGAAIAAAAAAAVLPRAVSIAAAVLGLTWLLRHRRRAHRRRGAEEGRALEGALDVLVGELSIGAHPVRAFEVAAAEAGQPAVAAVLATVAARARLGADVAAGLRGAAGGSALPVLWERLAVHWQLAVEHGLPIATLMRAAQRDIGERHRYSARVEAGMAGARASAAILAVLPVLGILLGQLIGARPAAFLLGAAGGPLLIAGVMLVCLGLLWSDRISGGPATGSSR